MTGRVEAVIALGGNMGDVRSSFVGARHRLAAHPDISPLASSRLYRSAPMGPQKQPDYLNAVLLVATLLAPLELLHLMQAIELQFGRKRDGPRWSERTLDLDLIAYDDTQMKSPELTLPHPGMQQRLFVLQPMCELRPQWRHPISDESAADMLKNLLASGMTPLAAGEAW